MKCNQQELFGAIGEMKKARLVKPGTAEVIYKDRSDARMAVKKYHQRELDGSYFQSILWRNICTTNCLHGCKQINYVFCRSANVSGAHFECRAQGH